MAETLNYTVCPGGNRQGHFADFFGIIAKGDDGHQRGVPGAICVLQSEERGGGKAELAKELRRVSEETGIPLDDAVTAEFDELGL